ncbi:MAG: A/G-specific adenine glycosylase, partial [Planctomycetia bacterium]|nr:A/G-specific adenine glycosylase [Planctomycetia bacterium]
MKTKNRTPSSFGDMAAIAPEMPPPEWRRALRARLRTWFRRAARPLPWRQNRDPYRVWLSEIMLQQTQVRTVEAYFERFVAALPTIDSLAAADVERVLRLWEGLGYYRRARQLHRAAGQIVRDHGGRFPEDVAAVRRLPGIGRYTAGAILSISFDQAQPIVEANTLRLYARLLAYRGDPTRAAGQQLLWRFAAAILPQRHAGEFNQALMELGSLVCLPRAPRCNECPLRSLCPTAAAGLQEVIPPRQTKAAPTEVSEAAVVVRRRGRVLMLRRDGAERWSGLWDFPRFPLAAVNDAAVRRELAGKVLEMCDVKIAAAEPLTTIRHSVTRYRITLKCFVAEGVSVPTKRKSGNRN